MQYPLFSCLASELLIEEVILISKTLLFIPAVAWPFSNAGVTSPSSRRKMCCAAELNESFKATHGAKGNARTRNQDSRAPDHKHSQRRPQRLTQPMPTLTDCNKRSRKAESGFSAGWPCWTSSWLPGREGRGEDTSARKGQR